MRNDDWGSIKDLKRDDQPLVSRVSWPCVTRELEIHSTLVLLLIFSLLSICFIVKSLALQYPAVIGDEYYYSILSHYFGDQGAVYAHVRRLPHLPNELYFWLFHSARLFGDNFYEFAKILNSLLFAAAIIPIYAVCRSFLRHVPALMLSTLIIIAPLENYTAYFMPESSYFLGFWLFVFLFVSNLPNRGLTAGIFGGVALGLLTLIKPHALAVLVGADVTLVTIAFLPQAFGLKWSDAVRCLVALNSAWLASVAALHVVLFGHRDLDIFGFYGRMAHPPILDRSVYTKHLITIVLEHLTYIAPMFGLPMVATLLAALGWLPAGASESRSHLRILSVFAIIVTGCLLVMTASATAMFVLFGHHSAAELGRMHGRYYDFALPLFLISFYGLRGGKPPERVRKPLACGLLVCLVLVLAGWRFLACVRPVYLTDYPEVAWVTQPHHVAVAVFWPVAALMLIYYAIVGLKERTVYSIYLTTTFIAGTILTVSAQHSLDFVTKADRAGALVRNLFHGKERDLGLVVGSEPPIVFRCLFGIQANPWVLEVPAGTVIDRRQIGQEVHWVLALDDYDLRVPSTTLLALHGLKVAVLQSAVTGVPVQSRLSGAKAKASEAAQNEPGR